MCASTMAIKFLWFARVNEGSGHNLRLGLMQMPSLLNFSRKNKRVMSWLSYDK